MERTIICILNLNPYKFMPPLLSSLTFSHSLPLPKLSRDKRLMSYRSEAYGLKGTQRSRVYSLTLSNLLYLYVPQLPQIVQNKHALKINKNNVCKKAEQILNCFRNIS